MSFWIDYNLDLILLNIHIFVPRLAQQLANANSPNFHPKMEQDLNFSLTTYHQPKTQKTQKSFYQVMHLVIHSAILPKYDEESARSRFER